MTQLLVCTGECEYCVPRREELFLVNIIIAVFNKVGVTAFFGQNQNFASLIDLKVILL
jgi:hypothetical protein